MPPTKDPKIIPEIKKKKKKKREEVVKRNIGHGVRG